ncbi:MAG TPA: tetratricopeptide repeat protein [Oculatellaceae cyanobacterium]
MNKTFLDLAKTLIVSACFLCTERAVMAESFSDTGERYYRQGNYAAAVSAFRWAIQQSPKDAKAHYLLANSLVQVGQLADARMQYQLTTTLSKDPQIITMCQSGLSALSGTGALRATAQQQGLQSGFQLGIQNQAATVQPQLFQKPTPASIARQKIDDQVTQSGNVMANSSSQDAASWQRAGQYMANQVQLNANNTATYMSRATYQGIPIYTANDIQAMQQQAQAQAQQDLNDAQDKGNRAVQYANAKMWETQAAAQNLEDLLSSPTRPGGSKLKADGTNLYVRAFEVPMNIAPPMSAHAKSLTPNVPLKAAPGNLTPGPATASGGKHPAGSQNGAKVESTVHGEVLP